MTGPVVDKFFRVYKKMAAEITTTGFSAAYAIFVLIGNLIFFSVFGILGGLTGMLFVNKKNLI